MTVNNDGVTALPGMTVQISITDVDIFKRILRILRTVVADPRIDEGIRDEILLDILRTGVDESEIKS